MENNNQQTLTFLINISDNETFKNKLTVVSLLSDFFNKGEINEIFGLKNYKSVKKSLLSIIYDQASAGLKESNFVDLNDYQTEIMYRNLLNLDDAKKLAKKFLLKSKNLKRFFDTVVFINKNNYSTDFNEEFKILMEFLRKSNFFDEEDIPQNYNQFLLLMKNICYLNRDIFKNNENRNIYPKTISDKTFESLVSSEIINLNNFIIASEFKNVNLYETINIDVLQNFLLKFITFYINNLCNLKNNRIELIKTIEKYKNLMDFEKDANMKELLSIIHSVFNTKLLENNEMTNKIKSDWLRRSLLTDK